jgi:hypothetical protein
MKLRIRNLPDPRDPNLPFIEPPREKMYELYFDFSGLSLEISKLVVADFARYKESMDNS